MNMMYFKQNLALLVEECGGILTGNIEIEQAATPRRERLHFYNEEPTDSHRAVRSIDPLRITVHISVDAVGDWHHESGDDRQLHPDLQDPKLKNRIEDNKLWPNGG